MIQNVLLIQGVEKDADLVCDALGGKAVREFQLEWVRTGVLGLERLAARSARQRWGPKSISAVLVDLRLPDFVGLGIVDSLCAAAPHIPIVVLFSTQDEVAAQEAITRGAQDFLLKEHVNSYLLPENSGRRNRACGNH